MALYKYNRHVATELGESELYLAIHGPARNWNLDQGKVFHGVNASYVESRNASFLVSCTFMYMHSVSGHDDNACA